MIFGELKQQRRQRQRKRHLKISIWGIGDYFVIFASFSHPLFLTEHAGNGLSLVKALSKKI